MAQQRLPMRKIRDVLRLSAAGLSKRQIAIAPRIPTVTAAAGSANSIEFWEGRLSPTMRQAHVAGEKLFVD